VKHLIKDDECGPKAWRLLKDVHAPSNEAMVVVLDVVVEITFGVATGLLAPKNESSTLDSHCAKFSP
jgi:hypothetical protein